MLAFLYKKFTERVISLHGDKEWPPRPSNFFSWEFVKSKVYSNSKAEIERVTGDIVCETVISNFEERINACRLSAGGHMADVVFHT